MIQQKSSVDGNVPVRTAYNQSTQFQERPRRTSYVEFIEERDVRQAGTADQGDV